MRRRSCQHCGARVDKGQVLIHIRTPAGTRLLCFRCRQKNFPFKTVRVETVSK